MKKELELVSFEMAEDMSLATVKIGDTVVNISPDYSVLILKALLQNIDFSKLTGRVTSYFLVNYKIVNCEVMTDSGDLLLCKLALNNDARRKLIVCMSHVLRGIDQFMLADKSVGFDSYGELHPILVNGVMDLSELMN